MPQRSRSALPLHRTVGPNPEGAGVVPHYEKIECEHGSVCAGCPLIQLSYEEQLQKKRSRVMLATSGFPTLELVFVQETVPATPFVDYRTRAKLTVGDQGEIGLYGPGGTHRVEDVEKCRVLSPEIASVVRKLRLLIRARKPATIALLAPFKDPDGSLLAIDTREVRTTALDGPSQVLLTLVLERSRARPLPELTASARILMKELPEVLSISANFRTEDAPQVLGPETKVLVGPPQARDYLGTAYHFASPGAFVQAHRHQATKLHASLAAEVRRLQASRSGRVRVLDLYGGSGAMALALAKASAQVTLVESFARAVENARKAAEEQNLDVRCIAADSSHATRTFVQQEEQFDLIVLNPPRRGVSPATRANILRLTAPVLAYVSCDPDTLARDLDHLRRAGYATREVSPFDMIPLTEEVESVAILKREAPPPPPVLYEDDDILAVEKGPHEGTLPMRDGPGVLGRCTPILNGRPAYPVLSISTDTSGITIFARTPEARDLWANALREARGVYVAALRGSVPPKGTINRDVGNGNDRRRKKTRYRRLATLAGHSVVRAIPEDLGGTSLGSHFAAIGHPILGDAKHGHPATNRYFEERHALDRPFLHLLRVEVAHPRSGARLVIESTLPPDLRLVTRRAGNSDVLLALDQKRALGDFRTSSFPPNTTETPDDGPPSGEGTCVGSQEQVRTDPED